MLARLFILAVCLPALATFCAGCAGWKPDHLVVGLEHDESRADSSRGLHTTTLTDKFEAHVIYDLPT